MSVTQSPQKRLLTICGPALAIVLAYHFALDRPLKVTLEAERAKLRKLETAVGRKANLELSKTKLMAAQAEIELLASQLQDIEQSGSRLVSRRDDLRSELLESRSPALVMAETLVLLSRHDLECIDSGPVIYDRDATVSASLKPVADMLGAARVGELPGRREMRITFRGRFQDVQTALQEMQVAPLGIFTVSLEMEVSDEPYDRHIWILTIAV